MDKIVKIVIRQIEKSKFLTEKSKRKYYPRITSNLSDIGIKVLRLIGPL